MVRPSALVGRAFQLAAGVLPGVVAWKTSASAIPGSVAQKGGGMAEAMPHLLMLWALVAMTGCSSPQRSSPPVVRVAHVPPEPKDIVDALLASSGTPLSVSPTCSGVGTEQADKTMGRYLSGFLAELSNPDAKNSIVTERDDRSPLWICRVFVRHAQGDDVWSWGVQFHISMTDGAVDPASSARPATGREPARSRRRGHSAPRRDARRPTRAPPPAP